MRKRKIEYVIFIVIALLTMGITGAAFRVEQRVAKQRIMFYQLQALRTSVNLFKSVLKRNPKSLRELAEAEFRFPGERRQRRYLDFAQINEEGLIVDPFGKPYVYDPNTGWVKSAMWRYW
jgi:hypothetical protein